MENSGETTLQRKPRIKWYRSPVDRESLKELGRKSDLKAMGQAGGHLLLLVFTGTCAWLAAGRLAWPWVVLILFRHGTFYAFLTNALHELIHKTVFKSKWLNSRFLWTFSCINRLDYFD
jgi:fatty acid desaturase